MRPVRRGSLALLAAVAVAGCGHARSERPAVAGYVKAVNRIESSLTEPLAQVTQAGTMFASELHPGRAREGTVVNSAAQTLQGALVRIRAAQAGLVALAAPTPAHHLRSLLIALTAGEGDMTAELRRLVVYLPHFDADLAGLDPAAARLERVLARRATGAMAVAAVYAAKAAALRRFKRSVEHVLARMRTLEPPPVSRPGYTAELDSLRGMAASADGLARALSTGALAKVDPLLTSFDKAATQSRTRAVQRAQIAAVRAYDARVTGLTALQDQIANERLRLSNSLR